MSDRWSSGQWSWAQRILTNISNKITYELGENKSIPKGFLTHVGEIFSELISYAVKSVFAGESGKLAVNLRVFTKGDKLWSEIIDNGIDGDVNCPSIIA